MRPCCEVRSGADVLSIIAAVVEGGVPETQRGRRSERQFYSGWISIDSAVLVLVLVLEAWSSKLDDGQPNSEIAAIAGLPNIRAEFATSKMACCRP